MDETAEDVLNGLTDPRTQEYIQKLRDDDFPRAEWEIELLALSFDDELKNPKSK